MTLIQVEDLSRTFTVRRKVGRLRRTAHEVRAVDGLSFEIRRGEMVGYIGPNGAGKSTTIKMLTGILVPSAGRLSVAGLDPSRDRVELTRRIGVVFGQRTTLWWDLPLRDSFELLRRIYRIEPARYRANLAEFTELLDLAHLLDTPVRQLSLGQRMRGDIAAALLHDPEILYLDEPTIGLDVVSKGRLREFLRRVNQERQVTLLLTTHDLQDIEQLCSRVMVIDHGTLVYDGSLPGLHDLGCVHPDPGGRPGRRRRPHRGPGRLGAQGRGTPAVAVVPRGRVRGSGRRRGGGGVRRRRPLHPGAGHRGRHPDALQPLSLTGYRTFVARRSHPLKS